MVLMSYIIYFYVDDGLRVNFRKIGVVATDKEGAISTAKSILPNNSIIYDIEERHGFE